MHAVEGKRSKQVVSPMVKKWRVRRGEGGLRFNSTTPKALPTIKAYLPPPKFIQL